MMDDFVVLCLTALYTVGMCWMWLLAADTF
jgi:hypothetical protein